MVSRDALLALCHRIGEPERDLVIIAEGNISSRGSSATMTIKASGCSLATMTADDLVDVRIDDLLGLLDAEGVDDVQTAEVYRTCRVDPAAPAMPSVEAILHAAIYRETEASVIVHTHPTAINAILCSASAGLLVAGALFPDQVVVLGRHQLLIPYTDPGVPLARAVRQGLQAFISEHGHAPRIIYLANHGIFALGETPDDALRITTMAVKAARILTGAIAAGGPVFLPNAQQDRIESRPDEHYRRQRIATEGGRA